MILNLFCSVYFIDSDYQKQLKLNQKLQHTYFDITYMIIISTLLLTDLFHYHMIEELTRM